MAKGDSFKFQNFTVYQEKSAMKVGTDGVILGSWVRCLGRERILDVGTGTGLIALMVAQRCESAQIDAVEIEQSAAIEANSNFEKSPYGDRIKCYNVDFQRFSKAECQKKYDFIVSNPPYFNGSYKSVDAQRTAARHSELLPSEDLIDGVVRVLDPNGGVFAAIFPYSNAAVFIAKAATRGLFCTRLLKIFPKPGREAKRMAAEFSLRRDCQIKEEELMILDSFDHYTDAYKELTKEFYIRF